MTTIVGGKLMQVNKDALRNFLKHNDNHNRIKEQEETWRCYEQHKQITREERSKSMVEKLSQRTGVMYKQDSPTALKSGYWTQKLMEVEEKADNRWGHTGYKELYPEEFGGAASNKEVKEELSQIKEKQNEPISVAQDNESYSKKSNWKRREYRGNQTFRTPQLRRSRSPPRKYLGINKSRMHSTTSPLLNRQSRRHSRSPTFRKSSKSPSPKKYSKISVSKKYSKSPSPKRHSRRKYSRSISPRKRSKSPKPRKRSKSISPKKSPRISQSKRHSRSPQTRKCSKSPIEDSTQSTRNQNNQNKLRRDDADEGRQTKKEIGKTIDSEDDKKYESEYNHKESKPKKEKGNSQKLLEDDVDSSWTEDHEVSQSELGKGKRSKKIDGHSNSKTKSRHKSKKKKSKKKKSKRNHKAGKWDRMDREESPSGDSISANEKLLKESEEPKSNISNEEETADNMKNEREAHDEKEVAKGFCVESSVSAVARENNGDVEQGLDFSGVATFDSQSEDKLKNITMSPCYSINISTLNNSTNIEEGNYSMLDNKKILENLYVKDGKGNPKTETDDGVNQDSLDKRLGYEYGLSTFHGENMFTNPSESIILSNDVEGDDKLLLEDDDDIYSDLIQATSGFRADKKSKKRSRCSDEELKSYSGDDESIDDYKKISTKRKRKSRSERSFSVDEHQSTGSDYSESDAEKTSSQKHKAGKKGRRLSVKQSRSKKSKYEDSYSSDISDADNYKKKYKQSDISKEKRQNLKSKKDKAKAKGSRSSSSNRDKPSKQSRTKSVKEKLYDDGSSDSSVDEDRKPKKNKKGKGRKANVKNDNSDIGSISDRSSSRKRSTKHTSKDTSKQKRSDLDSSSDGKVSKYKKAKKGRLHDDSDKSTSGTDYSSYTERRKKHKTKIKDDPPMEQKHNKVKKVKKSEVKDTKSGDKDSKKSKRKRRQTPIESSSSDKSDSDYSYEDRKKHSKSKKQKHSKYSDNNLSSDSYSEHERKKSKVTRKRTKSSEDSIYSSSQEESKNAVKKKKYSKTPKQYLEYESEHNTDSDITSEEDTKRRKVSIGTKNGKNSKMKKGKQKLKT